MRVLLLADSCNPDWASLPVVGYKACKAIADHVDVVVATHVRNRKAITEKGLGKAEVVYISNEYIARPWHKVSTLLRGGHSLSWTTGIAMSYPTYIAFEWETWKRFRDELATGEFDIVHRVTPMSPTIPSPMAKWSPVPFVIGPLNGGLRWPSDFTSELRREREWMVYLRNAYRYLPYHRATFEKASAILAAFQHTIDDLPQSAKDRMVDFPEVGIDPQLFNTPETKHPLTTGRRVEFLYVGRFVPYKCPDVAVSAFATNPALRNHRLRMIGDGPDRARLEEIVRKNGLGSCVEFLGWRTQEETGRLMRQADVFVFPSIRELGAGVVVEAMASGLAPVVVDYGAPGTLVTDECGVRLPLGPKNALIDSFAQALGSLAEDPARVERLAKASHRRALTHYSWDVKARKTLGVYEWILGKRTEKPDFGTDVTNHPANTGFT